MNESLYDGAGIRYSRQEYIAKAITPYITGKQWQSGLDMLLATVAISANRKFDHLGLNPDAGNSSASEQPEPSPQPQ